MIIFILFFVHLNFISKYIFTSGSLVFGSLCSSLCDGDGLTGRTRHDGNQTRANVHLGILLHLNDDVAGLRIGVVIRNFQKTAVHISAPLFACGSHLNSIGATLCRCTDRLCVDRNGCRWRRVVIIAAATCDECKERNEQ